MDVQRRDGSPGVAVVVVRGFVDTSTWKQLDTVLARLVAEGTRYAVVDLKDTEYVSSIGWGLFVAHSRPLTERGGALVLTSMRAELDHTYRSMGFAELVSSYADSETAIASLARSGEPGGAAGVV